MSFAAAHEWDVTVPDDGAELLAELRRHGVRPGRLVHMRVVEDEADALIERDFCGSLAGFPDPSWEDFEHASEIARSDFGVE
jgi:hypothetical protein